MNRILQVAHPGIEVPLPPIYHIPTLNRRQIRKRCHRTVHTHRVGNEICQRLIVYIDRPRGIVYTSVGTRYYQCYVVRAALTILMLRILYVDQWRTVAKVPYKLCDHAGIVDRGGACKYG